MRSGPEANLQKQILELAAYYNWAWYHPPDNRPIRAHDGKVRFQTVVAGWPDLILCRPPELIAVEVKSQSGRVSSEQSEWLRRLTVCGVETAVWRPDDWDAVQARLSRPLEQRFAA